MPSSILCSLANWSCCCPTLSGCPAPRILKNLGGQGGLIVAVASFLGVPGNNITPWGHLTQHAVQGGNWAMEQRGSPTQGALVTEGMDTLCARPLFQAGVWNSSVVSLGHQATQTQSFLHLLIIQKGIWVPLEQVPEQRESSLGGILDAGQTESEGQRLVSFWKMTCIERGGRPRCPNI